MSSGGTVPWLTLGCALALLVVFGVQLAYAAPSAQASLILLGANAPLLVREGEWFRLATASLLHAGLLHLTINAVALLWIGAFLEPVLGRVRLGLVLLCAVFAGSLASASLGGLRVSVGASTAVAGLVGALACVLVKERAARPPGWRLPTVVAGALVAVELLAPAAPAVDSMGHLGGLVAGVAATLLLLRGVAPAEPAGRTARALVAVLALAFALGVAQGAWRVASGDRSALFRQAEFALAGSRGSPAELNNLVYMLATQPDASRALLERAREQMAAVVRDEPVAAFVDTLAVVQYRLGDFDSAIASARAALAAEPHPGYATRLAWLEAARLERSGPLRLGPGAALGVELASSEEALELALAPPVEAPTTLHVLVRDGGGLRGLIELRVAPGTESARVELSESSAGERTFALALVDSRPDETEVGLRLLPYDPSLVPELPPPLPR